MAERKENDTSVYSGDPLQYSPPKFAGSTQSTFSASSFAGANPRARVSESRRGRIPRPPGGVGIKDSWPMTLDGFFSPSPASQNLETGRKSSYMGSYTPSDVLSLSWNGESEPSSSENVEIDNSRDISDNYQHTSAYGNAIGSLYGDFGLEYDLIGESAFLFDDMPDLGYDGYGEEAMQSTVSGASCSTISSNYSSAWESAVSDPSTSQSNPEYSFDFPLFDPASDGLSTAFQSNVDYLAGEKSLPDARESLGKVFQTPKTFKCWVKTCSHFHCGFATPTQRKTHYETAHADLILKCNYGGCRSSQSFLRKQDLARHETRMHPEVELARSSAISRSPGVKLEIGETIEISQNSTRDSPRDIDANGRPSKEASANDSISTTISQASRPSACSDVQSKRTPSLNRKDTAIIDTSPINAEMQANENSPDTTASQASSSASSDVSAGFDTDSTWSGEDTDWEDDNIDPNELLVQIIEDSKVLVKPLLTPMKRDLVNSVMEEFWIVFNHEWSANLQKCSGGGGSPGSTPSSTSQSKDKITSTPSQQAQKRQREGDGGEDEFDGDDKRDPKRQKMVSQPDTIPEKRQFACPYRKHDPRTYCHQVRCWRSCALTPLDTIARVKGHLYRCHRIFQCPRCKVLHKSEADLKSHGLEPEGCEVVEGLAVEGITGDIEKQLKSRKKAHRDQPEAERWQEMYRILFPMEEVPSPYFEAIQDDNTRSPDSEEFSGYEEFSRRELPRFFRNALEAAVADEARPIEERLRRQLVGMIQDCQDRVFSAYRSIRNGNSPSSNRLIELNQLGPFPVPSSAEQEIEESMEVSNPGVLETLYERVPPQVELPTYGETSLTGTTWMEHPISDSSYLSEPSLVRSNSVGIDSTNATQSTTAGSFQEQASTGDPDMARNSAGALLSSTLQIDGAVKKTSQLLNDPAAVMVAHSNVDDMLEDFEFENWMTVTGEYSFLDQQQTSESIEQQFK